MKTQSMGRQSRCVPVLLVAIAFGSTGYARMSQAQTPGPTQAAAPAQTEPVLVTMFNGNLTTKKAKVGDAITAKVKKTLKVGDLEIPGGSKLVGKVQAVQSQKDGNGNSTLNIQFEKVVMKGNKELPVRGLVVAIGKVSLAGGLGYSDILGRGGAGSTVGLDPNLAAGHHAKDEIGPGSSLPGVALATHLDANQATELRGIKCDIQLDPSVMMRVQLFRATPAS